MSSSINETFTDVHTPEGVVRGVSVNKDDATSYGGSTLLEDFEEKVSFLHESKYILAQNAKFTLKKRL